MSGQLWTNSCGCHCQECDNHSSGTFPWIRPLAVFLCQKHVHMRKTDRIKLQINYNKMTRSIWQCTMQSHWLLTIHNWMQLLTADMEKLFWTLIIVLLPCLTKIGVRSASLLNEPNPQILPFVLLAQTLACLNIYSWQPKPNITSTHFQPQP